MILYCNNHFGYSTYATDKVSLYRVILFLIWPLLQMLIAIFYREYGEMAYVNYNLFLGLVLPLPLLVMYCYDNNISFNRVLFPFKDSMLLLLLLSWLPGAILGVDSVHSIMFIMLVCMTVVISAFYITICSEEEVRVAIAIFALVCPFVLLAKGMISGQLFASFRTSGFDVLPINSIAFFSMTCASFAFAWKNAFMKIVTIVIGSILLFSTNSRSCIIGLLFSVLSYMYVLHMKKNKLAVNVVVILLLLSSLFIMWEKIYSAVDAVLFLNDASRGLDSGFSGRLGRWGSAISAIKSNMIYGVGFRCSNKYFGVPLDNGYLMYIVENGVFSSFVALIIIVRAMIYTIGKQNDGLGSVFLIATIGYLVHSVFESFIFNVGNSGSLLFIFWLVYSIKLKAIK